MSIDYFLLKQKFIPKLSHIGENKVLGCEMLKDSTSNIYSQQNEEYYAQPKIDVEFLPSGIAMFEFK